MPQKEPIELPREVVRALMWFIANHKSGKVTLNFAAGAIRNLDLNIHEEVNKG